MVSLVSIILNLLGKTTLIKVRRFPPAKVLRIHLLGLTLGLVFTLLAIVLDYKLLFAGLPLYVAPAFVLLFAFGTRFGGIFILFLVIFLSSYSGSTGALETLHTLAGWYMWGYVAGAILSLLYNDLIFLYFITFGRDKVKISFVFEPGKLNIIKSPRICEEHPILNSKLKDQKLYDYDFENPLAPTFPNSPKQPKPPDHPFTIAFVANPKILKRGGNANRPEDYITDPIMFNMRLFLRSVDDALSAFESNEVIGRPEIWSRVRVVALFDRNLGGKTMSGQDFGMVQPSQNIPSFGGVVAENLLDPMEQMVGNYKNIVGAAELPSHLENVQFPDEVKEGKTISDLIELETDVVFALSASLRFNRSSAHHTNWIESLKEDPNKNQANCTESETDTPENNHNENGKYCFDPDPYETKNTEKNIEIISASCADDSRFTCEHENYSIFPGRVALNVLSATRKTWVHEFAHAMSNAFRGAIVDEYYDTSQVSADDEINDNGNDNGTGNGEEQKMPFYVNRIERKRNDDGTIVPVHKVYAKYEDTVFTSDMNHPSSEEHWIGYFPDRKSPRFTCTMDRTYGDYRFDELLTNFMYDRLITKMNRPVHKDAKEV